MTVYVVTCYVPAFNDWFVLGAHASEAAAQAAIDRDIAALERPPWRDCYSVHALKVEE